jgi:hypothetical protein
MDEEAKFYTRRQILESGFDVEEYILRQDKQIAELMDMLGRAESFIRTSYKWEGDCGSERLLHQMQQVIHGRGEKR